MNVDILIEHTRRGKRGNRAPGTVHHSLGLDSGGSADLKSELDRLLSKESNSPTDFSEGRVRLSESSEYRGDMEDECWWESSTSSAGTIDDDEDDDVANVGGP